MNDALKQILDGDNVDVIIASMLEEAKADLSNKAAGELLQKKIGVGDVLILGPDISDKRWATRAYYTISRGLFGSAKNIHVEMYVGSGKTVGAGPDKGVAYSPLSAMTKKRSHISLFRAKVSRKERVAAARYVKKQVGKKFSKYNIGGTIIKEFDPDAPVPAAEDSFTCSGLIAQAYPQIVIGRRKGNKCFATPVDIRRSRGFKQTLELNRALSGKFTASR